MRPGGTGLCVVGDDAQAIYGFRAASAGNMADFEERFPGAATVTLERNYRSTKPILDTANALIASAPGMLKKQLWTERPGGETPSIVTCTDEAAEAIAVCEAVLAAYERGVPLREQAVLCRAAHHTARLEVELSQRNIPYRKYGGLRFLEAAHVKDLIALLRLVDNSSDELAWRRVLLLLDGVGPAITRRVLDFLGLPDPAARPKLRSGAGELGLSAPAQVSLMALLDALDDCGQDDDEAPGSQPPPAEQIERLTALCRPFLQRRYPDAAQRLADLEQLAGMAGEHKTRAAFLGDLLLDPPTATSDLAGNPHIDDDWLVLSTVHSAKGLEWTNVFVIHVSDGNFPSDMALREPEGLEEERRLLYVAVTRARDQLQLSFPLRYYKHREHLDDIHFYGQPSRFLRTIDRLCEQSFVGHDDAPGAGGVVAAAPGADPVTVQLSSLWSS
jgi:DNA helicase-2/ATP-dependent DNA helicase PcrA